MSEAVKASDIAKHVVVNSICRLYAKHLIEEELNIYC